MSKETEKIAKKPEEKKGNKGLIIGLILALLLAMVGGGIYFASANKKYTITFHTEGGNEMAPIQVKKGSTLPVISDPIKSGYVFVKWVNGDGSDIDKTAVVNADMDIYATYRLKCTVTVNDNNGSEEKYVVAEGEKVKKPDDPFKQGYVFDCWVNNGEKYDFDLPVKGDITIEATYKKILKVTFVYNDNTTADKVVDVVQGNTVDKPADPSLSCYDFVGWYFEGNLYDFASPVEADYTIEAKYSLIAIEPTAINAKDMTISKGEKADINATITPSNANSKTKLSYSSSNTKVATVDSKGTVNGVGAGTATITIKAENDVTKKITVTVLAAPTAISAYDITVNKGETGKLEVSITPSDANSKTKLSYTSADTSIAKVDGNGIVTGVAPGATKITIKTENNVEKTVNVYVDDAYIYLYSVSNLENKTVRVYKDKVMPFKIYLVTYKKGVKKTADITQISTLQTSAEVLSNTLRYCGVANNGEYYQYIGGSTSSATNPSTINGSFYFEYKENGKSYTTDKFSIQVEPIVAISDVSGEVYNWNQSGITLNSKGSYATITMNCYGTWTYTGNVKFNSTFLTTDSYRMGITSDASMSSPAIVTFTTRAGQVIKFSVIAR